MGDERRSSPEPEPVEAKLKSERIQGLPETPGDRRAAKRKRQSGGGRWASSDLFRATLDQLEMLATALETGALPRARLERGEVEAAYFDHAGLLLAGELRALEAAQRGVGDPNAADLDAFREAFPRASATYHVRRAAAALRQGAQSLQAAVARFEFLLVGGAAHQGTAAWLFTAVSLRSLLETQVLPARDTLQDLVTPPGFLDGGWGVGPWRALDVAGREMYDLAERLLAAFDSIPAEELATATGKALAHAVAKVTSALQRTALLTFDARNRLEEPALTGLAGSRRLGLRLQGMAQVAERWQAELRAYRDQLEIQRLGQEGMPPPRGPLVLWLETQIEGPLASVVLTLRQLAVEVPLEDDPSPGLVA